MLPSHRNVLAKILSCGMQLQNHSSCCRVIPSLPNVFRLNLGLTNFSLESRWSQYRKFGISICNKNAESTHLRSEKEGKPVSKDSTTGDAANEDSKAEENIDWHLKAEIEKYELGKRWLATMMGEDVDTFTDEKIAEAIQYLLPSHLFAKDARPMMADPMKLFGKKKEARVDPDGRPLHAAFYTGQPAYHELIYQIWEKLEELDNIMQEMQVFEAEDTASFYYDKPLLVRWLKQHEMESKLNCKLMKNQYDLLIRRLTRIANHPHGETMQDFLSTYQKELTQGGKKIEVAEIDEDGYVTVMGYRKSAIAEVRLKEGSGKIMINNMPMTKYFDNFEHRQQVIYPFMVVDQLGRFDVDAGVIGGGETGQSGAIRLGISRALLSFSPTFYQPLEEAGLLVRDMRRVERKKPGRMKARRKFAWVKR